MARLAMMPNHTEVIGEMLFLNSSGVVKNMDV